MTEPEVERCDGCEHWFAAGTLHPFRVAVSTKGHMQGGKIELCSACARAVRAATPRAARRQDA